MSSTKNICKVAFKIILRLIGMLFIFVIAANYKGTQTYPSDVPYLFLALLISLGLIFLGFFLFRPKVAEGGQQKASVGVRFMNFFIDMMMIRFISIWIVTANIFFFRSQFNRFGQALVSIVFGCLMMLVYYFVFESIFQKTPAKFITLSKVVDPKGGRSKVMTIFIRSFLRLLPFEPISIFVAGGLWHDQYSKTEVIGK